MKKKGEAYWDFERCYVSTKRLPDLGKGAPIVTDTVLLTTSAHLLRKVTTTANKAKEYAIMKRREDIASAIRG